MNTFSFKVVLTKSEVNYLLSSRFLSPTLLQFLTLDERKHVDGAMTIEVSDKLAEEFRGAFTERLARVGFDKNYEPTKEGRLLEYLIDRFFELKAGTKARVT